MVRHGGLLLGVGVETKPRVQMRVGVEIATGGSRGAVGSGGQNISLIFHPPNRVMKRVKGKKSIQLSSLGMTGSPHRLLHHHLVILSSRGHLIGIGMSCTNLIGRNGS